MEENPYLLLGAGVVPMESEKPIPKNLRQVGLKIQACEYFPDGSSGEEKILVFLISEPKALELMDYLQKETKELLERIEKKLSEQ